MGNCMVSASLGAANEQIIVFFLCIMSGPSGRLINSAANKAGQTSQLARRNSLRTGKVFDSIEAILSGLDSKTSFPFERASLPWLCNVFRSGELIGRQQHKQWKQWPESQLGGKNTAIVPPWKVDGKFFNDVETEQNQLVDNGILCEIYFPYPFTRQAC